MRNSKTTIHLVQNQHIFSHMVIRLVTRKKTSTRLCLGLRSQCCTHVLHKTYIYMYIKLDSFGNEDGKSRNVYVF